MYAGSAGWVRRLLLWAVIIGGVALVAGVARLPEHMGCQSSGDVGGGRAHMDCRYTLLSPEAWRALPARRKRP